MIPTAVALIADDPTVSRNALMVHSPSAFVTDVAIPFSNRSPSPPVHVQRIPVPEEVLSVLRTVAVYATNADGVPATFA